MPLSEDKPGEEERFEQFLSSVMDRTEQKGAKDQVVRMFIGLPVPERARAPILEAAQTYFPQYLEKFIASSDWHVTLAFLGDIVNPTQYLGRLSRPLPQAFVPTVSVTHIGRGLQRNQLWAYIQPSQSLTQLRAELLERLGEIRFPTPHRLRQERFVPHIRIAKFYHMARPLGMSDAAVMTTFAVHALSVYRSELHPEGAQHSALATIPLSN